MVAGGGRSEAQIRHQSIVDFLQQVDQPHIIGVGRIAALGEQVFHATAKLRHIAKTGRRRIALQDPEFIPNRGQQFGPRAPRAPGGEVLVDPFENPFAFRKKHIRKGHHRWVGFMTAGIRAARTHGTIAPIRPPLSSVFRWRRPPGRYARRIVRRWFGVCPSSRPWPGRG